MGPVRWCKINFSTTQSCVTSYAVKWINPRHQISWALQHHGKLTDCCSTVVVLYLQYLWARSLSLFSFCVIIVRYQWLCFLPLSYLSAALSAVISISLHQKGIHEAFGSAFIRLWAMVTAALWDISICSRWYTEGTVLWCDGCGR